MCTWWFILLVFYTFALCVNSNIDLDTTIASARCRAFCMYKMQSSQPKLDCCNFSNCSQGSESLEACKFHSPPPRPVSTAPLEEMLVVNQSTVSWPPTPGPVIYVVMTDGTQLCQTLQSSVSLPPSVDPTTVRVLVVDWRGLVKVFCPVEESPIDQTLHILRSLGMEGEFNGNLPKNSSHHTNLKITCSPPWRLSIESVLQQPPLVVVQISWRHYHNQLIKIKGVTSYMVTWTMSEGVVKGNVFTNASTITLSLLPETVYRIQVLRFDEKCQSEVIVLDTSSSSKTNLSSTWNGDISQSSIIMYRWKYARHVAMLVFILVIAGVVWRWRYLPKNRKFYERI